MYVADTSLPGLGLPYNSQDSTLQFEHNIYTVVLNRKQLFPYVANC